MAPSEDQHRSNVNALARFNDQVFAYTASLALPVVDRRVQVLLEDNLDGGALETILPPEPQPVVARLAHGLDKVLFKYVIYQMIYIVFLYFVVLPSSGLETQERGRSTLIPSSKIYRRYKISILIDSDPMLPALEMR